MRYPKKIAFISFRKIEVFEFSITKILSKNSYFAIILNKIYVSTLKFENSGKLGQLAGYIQTKLSLH